MAWFSCATPKPITTNTGGTLSPNIGCLIHHAVTDSSTLYPRFNDPSSQVSAHFYITQSGHIEQYVDTSVVAWHARDLNVNYVGVETQGCATPPYADPMSDAMIDAFATLYSEGMARHNWPAILCEQKGMHGFGYHRLPGSDNAPGGRFPTGCPCDLRKNNRQTILNRITNPTPAPKPPPPTPPPPEIEDLIPLTCMLDKDGNNLIYGVDPQGNL